MEAEDYDTAKSLKSEIDALYRAAIEGRDISSSSSTSNAAGGGAGGVHMGNLRVVGSIQF